MAAKSHGMSRGEDGKKTYMYLAWSNMKQRCYNSKSKEFANYGGRGIRVCDRWLQSFANFYADMGERPSTLHSLDRRDNEVGYTPKNCRWATREEQLLNQRDRQRICRKTDALLLDLAPKLHDMGFSMRNIALLFSVGKTTVERALRGEYEGATVVEGKVFIEERRHRNHLPRVGRACRG